MIAPDHQEQCKQEIGEPTEILQPRLAESYIGVVFTVALMLGGVVLIALTIAMIPNKWWCAAGVILILGGAALFYLFYSQVRNAALLVIGPKGFALSSKKGLTTCRWEQITEVRTEEVEYQEQAMPMFKGPLGKVKYTRTDRTYYVVDHTGTEHEFSAMAYTNQRVFRQRLEEETKQRDIPWHYKHEVLED